jgi:hypothetical protein
MAEHKEESESVVESVMEKISEKIHGHDDSSSSSDSDNEKSSSSSSAAAAVKEMKAKVYRLFGRETPVHSCLGGGKRMILIFLTFFIV